MREYKFRFWNKEKKIMCLKDEDNSSSYWDGVDCSVVELINNELSSEFTRQDYEIMQYTGMKDINGTEIYEGDIVKDDYCIYEVVYDGNGYYIKVVRLLKECGTQKGLLYNLSDYADLEVIGNLYDNFELLKEEL